VLNEVIFVMKWMMTGILLGVLLGFMGGVVTGVLIAPTLDPDPTCNTPVVQVLVPYNLTECNDMLRGAMKELDSLEKNLDYYGR